MALADSTGTPAVQVPAAQGLPHGGDLDTARRLYPHAPLPWLDLSTGINSWPYPVGPIPREAWRRLPDASSLRALREAAAGCYGAPDPACVAAAPGTQALIQLLPRLRPPGRVLVQSPTYGEHARCWALAGHQVAAVPDLGPKTADACVLVNPNNPDGRRHPPELLLDWAARLSRRGGWLVVDEAFADVVPETSVAGHAGAPGLVVLRSFGKFYGLAGVRLGFLLAAPALAARVADWLGPWAIPGPAIAVGCRALADRAWADAMRARLAGMARALDRLLTGAGLEVIGGTDLFRLARHPDAQALAGSLAQAGIWVRRFPDRPDLLRFGLPGRGMARLERALARR